MEGFMTLGEAAKRLKVPIHRVQYLFQSRKLLDEDVQRLAGRRVLTVEQFRQVADLLGLGENGGEKGEK